jgi:hypothetical protein
MKINNEPSGRKYFEKMIDEWRVHKNLSSRSGREVFKKILKEKEIIKKSTTELSEEKLYTLGHNIEFSLFHPEFHLFDEKYHYTVDYKIDSEGKHIRLFSSLNNDDEIFNATGPKKLKISSY